MKKVLAIGIIIIVLLIFTPIFLPLISNQADKLTSTAEKTFVFQDAISVNIPTEFVRDLPDEYLIQYTNESEMILIQAYPTNPNSPQERKEVREAIQAAAERRGGDFTNELIESEINGDTYELVEVVSSNNRDTRSTTLYKLFGDIGIKLTYMQEQNTSGQYVNTVNPQDIFESIELR